MANERVDKAIRARAAEDKQFREGLHVVVNRVYVYRVEGAVGELCPWSRGVVNMDAELHMMAWSLRICCTGLRSSLDLQTIKYRSQEIDTRVSVDAENEISRH